MNLIGEEEVNKIVRGDFSGLVYFDLYEKIMSSSCHEFILNGYDPFGVSNKRTFVVDFTITNDYDFVTNDVDGQDRYTFCDIGVDEFNTAEVVIFPLEPENVGLNAVDFVLSGWNHGILPGNYQFLKNYPNPFNSVITIEYGIEDAGNTFSVMYWLRLEMITGITTIPISLVK